MASNDLPDYEDDDPDGAPDLLGNVFDSPEINPRDTLSETAEGLLVEANDFDNYRRGYDFYPIDKNPMRNQEARSRRRWELFDEKWRAGRLSAYQSNLNSVPSGEYTGTPYRRRREGIPPQRPEPEGLDYQWEIKRDLNYDKLSEEWVPLKILGQGGFGKVQAAQYGAVEFEAQIGKVIVVKNSVKEDSDLGNELEKLRYLERAKSEHLLRTVLNPEGPNPTKHIYLEFCSGKDLHNEISRRWKDGLYPSEKNLWRTFHCLAKGLMAMNCGSESSDPDERKSDWKPVIHFDLKPENVLIGSKDELEHRLRRIYKIADFGNSAFTDEIGADWENKSRKRKCGTWGWLFPGLFKMDSTNLFCGVVEFTKRWDYIKNDADLVGSGDVAGNYTTQANTWAVGAMMWCLALLATHVMPLFNGYRSRMPDSSDMLAQGATYGKAIESTDYSNKLKVLILRCLMERPDLRPDNETLLSLTAAGVEDTADHEDDDNWDDQMDLGRPDKVVSGRFSPRNIPFSAGLASVSREPDIPPRESTPPARNTPSAEIPPPSTGLPPPRDPEPHLPPTARNRRSRRSGAPSPTSRNPTPNSPPLRYSASYSPPPAQIPPSTGNPGLRGSTSYSPPPAQTPPSTGNPGLRNSASYSPPPALTLPSTGNPGLRDSASYSPPPALTLPSTGNPPPAGATPSAGHPTSRESARASRPSAREPSPPRRTPAVAFPNYSNGQGRPGVNLKRRRRDPSEASQEGRPAQRRRIGGSLNAADPNEEVMQDLPSLELAHDTVPDPVQGVRSRWSVNEPNSVGDSQIEVNTFTWTQDLIDTYAGRYRQRAQRCGYQNGVRNADDRPEDVARLQKDWENQSEGREGQSLTGELRQMVQDFKRAEQERSDRLEAAQEDATQAVGYTPGNFQAAGATIQAHVFQRRRQLSDFKTI